MCQRTFSPSTQPSSYIYRPFPRFFHFSRKKDRFFRKIVAAEHRITAKIIPASVVKCIGECGDCYYLCHNKYSTAVGRVIDLPKHNDFLILILSACSRHSFQLRGTADSAFGDSPYTEPVYDRGGNSN